MATKKDLTFQEKEDKKMTIRRKIRRTGRLLAYHFSAINEKARLEAVRTSQAYKYINQDLTQSLMTASLSEVERKMEIFLDLKQSSVDLKEAIMLDYFVAGIYWAQGQNYTNQQFSGFFSLLYDLLMNVKDKQMSLGKNVLELRKALAGIALAEVIPECGGMMFFELDAAKQIIEYFQVTLFQHYCLYQYLYTHIQAEQIIGTDLKIVPVIGISQCFAPPLIEGMPEKSYNDYIDLPPETEAEVDETELQVEASQPEGPDMSFLNSITKEEVGEIFQEVIDTLLPTVQDEIAAQIRDQETQLVKKINDLCSMLTQNTTPATAPPSKKKGKK